MKAEYGAYLAYTYSALKSEGMDDMVWKIEKLDWQAVAERISLREETEINSRIIKPSPRQGISDQDLLRTHYYMDTTSRFTIKWALFMVIYHPFEGPESNVSYLNPKVDIASIVALAKTCQIGQQRPRK